MMPSRRALHGCGARFRWAGRLHDIHMGEVEVDAIVEGIVATGDALLFLGVDGRGEKGDAPAVWAPAIGCDVAVHRVVGSERPGLTTVTGMIQRPTLPPAVLRRKAM